MQSSILFGIASFMQNIRKHFQNVKVKKKGQTGWSILMERDNYLLGIALKLDPRLGELRIIARIAPEKIEVFNKTITIPTKHQSSPKAIEAFLRAYLNSQVIATANSYYKMFMANAPLKEVKEYVNKGTAFLKKVNLKGITFDLFYNGEPSIVWQLFPHKTPAELAMPSDQDYGDSPILHKYSRGIAKDLTRQLDSWAPGIFTVTVGERFIDVGFSAYYEHRDLMDEL